MGRQANRGITLVELCFGLAIVGLLAGLAAPSLRAARNAGAVHGATFELAAGLQQARASAIVEGRAGVLCPSDVAGKCHTGRGPATAWRAFLEQDGRETTLALRSLPVGVTLQATRSRLTFWPHSLAASPVTLTICDVHGIARPRAIVVSQAGRARITDAPPGRCGA
jgi:type II secretion system protein H